MAAETIQKYGSEGYDQNGLGRPSKEYRFCMVCGQALPQHYLETATGSQKFVQAGYPICDKPECQDIDREFSRQIRQNGILNRTYAISERWHAYNPVTGAQIVR